MADIVRAHTELYNANPQYGSAISFAAIGRYLKITPAQLQQVCDENLFPPGYDVQRASLPHRYRAYYLKRDNSEEYDAGRGWLAAVLVKRD